MPLESAQTCRLIISTGGRLFRGRVAHTASTAARNTAKAPSAACASSGSESGAIPLSNIAEKYAGSLRATYVLEGGKRRGAAVVPGALELGAEALESLPRDVGDEPLPVAVMPIGRGRAHAGGARGFRKREAGQAALGDEVERRPDQRLAQVAVMVAAPPRRRPASRPAHVRISYMNRAARAGGP